VSAEDSYRSQVALLRQWGYTVKEQPGCYGANNGASWNSGDRKGQVNHHFVCPLAPPADPQGFVDMLVNGYDDTPGPVVNWSIDAVGVIYLIATGPCNHAGQGNSSVLARVVAGQAPLGPAVDYAPGNDFNGNEDYDGVELLHPGDSTPYPDPMIDSTVALNASRCSVLGQSPNSSIMHYEHTDRKDDMSWEGGVEGIGGPDLRSRVASKLGDPNTGGNGDDDMPLNDDDKTWIKNAITGALNTYFANGEGNPTNGRIVQAAKNAIGPASTGGLVETAAEFALRTQFSPGAEVYNRVKGLVQDIVTADE
jgi:hypothetical protein